MVKHADMSDAATELEEFERRLAINNRKPELKATGRCYNCEEPVVSPARFCDEECRHDYEMRSRNTG